mgnify:CR=1 FL=1
MDLADALIAIVLLSMNLIREDTDLMNFIGLMIFINLFR